MFAALRSYSSSGAPKHAPRAKTLGAR